MHDTTSTPAAHEMRLHPDARQPMTRRLWLVAAAVAFAACSEGDPDRSAAVTTDSAGVEIVEITDAVELDTATLRVASDQALRIGVTDGAEPYLFSGIAGVARLSDGPIVVADRGSDQIRFYDSAGIFVHSVGGSGEGPTEFRSLQLMTRFSGDSLMVIDQGGTRLTVLDPQGTRVRRIQMAMTSEGETPRAWGIFGDGSQLVMPYSSFREISTGVVRHESGFRRTSEGQAPIADFPGAVQAVLLFGAGAPSDAREDPGPPPPEWAVGREVFHFAPDPGRFEIWTYSAEGARERIVRSTRASAGTFAGGGSADPRIRSLAVDVADRPWIQVQGAEEELEERTRWVVLDEEGTPRHTVDLPHISNSLGGRPVIEIGEDYVLLATTNDADVPVVVLLPLIEVSAG